MALGWLDRSSKNYRRTFRAATWSVAIALLLAGFLYWFSFCAPRNVVYTYLSAINEGNFERAHSMLTPDFARRWELKSMVRAYKAFSGHENVKVNRPEVFPNPFSPIFSRYVCCQASLDYHIVLTHADYITGSHTESYLWAQLYNKSSADAMASSALAPPVEVRVHNECKFDLILCGFEWRINGFDKRVSDGLKW